MGYLSASINGTGPRFRWNSGWKRKSFSETVPGSVTLQIVGYDNVGQSSSARSHGWRSWLRPVNASSWRLHSEPLDDLPDKDLTAGRSRTFLQLNPPSMLHHHSYLHLTGCFFHPFSFELIGKAVGLMSCFTYTFLLIVMSKINGIFALNNYKSTVYDREMHNADLKQPHQSRSEHRHSSSIHLEAASAPGNQPAHPEISFCGLKPASAPRN